MLNYTVQPGPIERVSKGQKQLTDRKSKVTSVMENPNKHGKAFNTSQITKATSLQSSAATTAH